MFVGFAFVAAGKFVIVALASCVYWFFLFFFGFFLVAIWVRLEMKAILMPRSVTHSVKIHTHTSGDCGLARASLLLIVQDLLNRFQF